MAACYADAKALLIVRFMPVPLPLRYAMPRHYLALLALFYPVFCFDFALLAFCVVLGLLACSIACLLAYPCSAFAL